jgi:hypothetical protein
MACSVDNSAGPVANPDSESHGAVLYVAKRKRAARSSKTFDPRQLRNAVLFGVDHGLEYALADGDAGYRENAGESVSDSESDELERRYI